MHDTEAVLGMSKQHRAAVLFPLQAPAFCAGLVITASNVCTVLHFMHVLMISYWLANQVGFSPICNERFRSDMTPNHLVRGAPT